MKKNKNKKINRIEFIKSSIRNILVGLFAVFGVRLVLKKQLKIRKRKIISFFTGVNIVPYAPHVNML